MIKALLASLVIGLFSMAFSGAGYGATTKADLIRIESQRGGNSMWKMWRWRRRIRKIVEQTIYDIEYLKEPKGENTWQSPDITEELGTGDCEDIQLLIRARLVRANLVKPEEATLLIGNNHAVLKIVHGSKTYYADNTLGLQPWNHTQMGHDVKEVDLHTWWDKAHPLGD